MNVRVAIPISNEQPQAITWAVRHWQSLGIKPFFGVDNKFSDVVVPLLETLGVKEFGVFQNPGETIEANYQNFCELVPSKLICRFDLDEIPGKLNLLKEINKRLEDQPSSIIGIPRLQLIARDGSIKICKNIEFKAKTHIQWRGFNSDSVEWDSRIHTAGFFVDEDRKVALGDRFSFLHLNWLMLSQEQLFEKSERYDRSGQQLANREQHVFNITDAKTKPMSNFVIRRRLEKSLAGVFPLV